MVEFKIDFKVSCPKSQEGMVYYQVSYKRTMKQICTGYKLYLHEWDKRSSEIVFSSFSEERNAYLQVLQTKIVNDKRILKRIIAVWEKRGASYEVSGGKFAFILFYGESDGTIETCGKSADQ